jgi:hypothetical protein
MASDAKMADDETSVSGPRDIRADIANKLSGTAHPSLKNFFESLHVEVTGGEATLALFETLQRDATGNEFLKIIDSVVGTLNNRYNTLSQQGAEAQATINSLQEAIKTGTAELTKCGADLAKHKEALTRIRAERDTWEKAAKTVKTNGDGDRDGSMPHPTAFTGDEKDTAKRTNQFRTWQTRIEGRWVSRPLEFNTEGKKIIYAAALLEGSAAAGVFAGVQKVTENPDDPTAWMWKSASDFMNHLARKYATMDLAANAENKLRSLSQKDEFASFTDFLTEYTNLTDVCDWDSTARVRGFRERLSRRMREALNMQVTTPERDNFEGWVEMAQKLAINIEGEDHLRKMAPGNGNNQNRGAGNNAGNGAKGKDLDAMDVDQMKINMAKIPEEERLRRANDGLCFNCGKAGHQARACRSPTYAGRGGRGGTRGGGARGGYSSGFGNQGPPQGQYNPQQGGGNNYFGNPYQQPRAYNVPGYNASTGAGNGSYQGAPARRGGMRGDYRGGYNPQVRFMNVQTPGRVVGEVDSEDGWSGESQPTADYDGRSEDIYNQGNA